MQISINLPFDELLTVIKKLNPNEKKEIAKLLIMETEVSEDQWEIALKRKKDFEAAKKFVEENKDDLCEYFNQAKSLVSGNEMVSGALDKIKGLF